MTEIYLDYAANTPLCKTAITLMQETTNLVGNPNSPHRHGMKLKVIVNDTEKLLRKTLNLVGGKIFWTANGSEANRLIINVVYRHNLSSKDIRTISTQQEHKSILKELAENGLVYTASLNKYGCMDPLDIAMLINDSSFNFVTCMHVNNETGIIQPINTIGAMRNYTKHMHFHVDACQSIGKIPVDTEKINCDSLSGSAHKFGGPQGVGFLWVRNPEDYEFPYMGTPNVVGIAGLKGALEELSTKNTQDSIEKEWFFTTLLNQLFTSSEELTENFPNYKFKRIPGMLSLAFKGIDNQILQFMLSDAGISVSTGSACNSGPSYVLEALGIPKDIRSSTIRISFNGDVPTNILSEAARKLHEVVRKERHGSQSL